MIATSARRLGRAAFSRLNPGNISIRHHYTGDPVRLHSFHHMDYWLRGRRRGQAEMATFADLIRPGDQVVEIGGRIGYLTLFFAWLVGRNGLVHVFEADPENLRYLRANVYFHKQVTVIETVDDTAVDLDDHVCETGMRPDVVRIDGSAWEVLQAAAGTLRSVRPIVMICSARNDVGPFLTDLGYRLYTTAGERVSRLPDHPVDVVGIPFGRELPMTFASREAV
jgi:tRNA A58 N-methylase Trm61